MCSWVYLIVNRRDECTCDGRLSMSEGEVFHEKQRLELCAIHALNNVLQERVFTKETADDICKRWAYMYMCVCVCVFLPLVYVLKAKSLVLYSQSQSCLFCFFADLPHNVWWIHTAQCWARETMMSMSSWQLCRVGGSLLFGGTNAGECDSNAVSLYSHKVIKS